MKSLLALLPLSTRALFAKEKEKEVTVLYFISLKGSKAQLPPFPKIAERCRGNSKKT